MAQSPALSNLIISLFLVLFLGKAMEIAESNELKETNMSLYFQDISAGENATVFPIAGIGSNELWTFSRYGTAFVTDDPITEGPDPKSPQVGRGQGIYVTSGLDGLNTHVLISIVFTNEEYGGSSLEIQGVSKQFELVREVSVVSGTGKFRFARGYATFETLSFDYATALALIRCNVTVLHY